MKVATQHETVVPAAIDKKPNCLKKTTLIKIFASTVNTETLNGNYLSPLAK